MCLSESYSEDKFVSESYSEDKCVYQSLILRISVSIRILF